MGREFPREAAWLVDRAVGSVEALEILLLLRRAADRAWLPSEVADELRTNADSAANWLGIFARSGLARREGDGFRWSPGAQEATAADVLAAEYERRRFHVIEQILARAFDPAREFADAFRLGQREDS